MLIYIFTKRNTKVHVLRESPSWPLHPIAAHIWASTRCQTVNIISYTTMHLLQDNLDLKDYRASYQSEDRWYPLLFNHDLDHRINKWDSCSWAGLPVGCCSVGLNCNFDLPRGQHGLSFWLYNTANVPKAVVHIFKKGFCYTIFLVCLMFFEAFNQLMLLDIIY